MPDGAAVRHPPDHDAAAHAPGARPLLPPARARTAGRSSTPASACPTRRRSGREALDGAEVARIFVTHFHPDHVGAAADVAELTGAPVHQGALDYAQCELVWGNPNWPERIADWFRTHGVPSEITEELIGSGDVYRAVHPLPARSDPARRRRPARRLGARRRAGPRRRAALPAQGRRARLGRPPARPDLADRRALAGEPARPARRLPRVARADDRARARDRASRARRPDRRSGRPRPRADRAPPRAARLRGGHAHRRPAHRLRRLVRPLRRRAEAGVPPFRRRRDALAPRAARARGAGGTGRGRRNRCLYCAPAWTKPSSTHAPESGA